MLGHSAVQCGPPTRTHALVQRLAHQVVRERAVNDDAGRLRALQQRRNVDLGEPGDSGQAAHVRRRRPHWPPGAARPIPGAAGRAGAPAPAGRRRYRAGRRAATGLQPGDLGGEEGVATAAPMNLGEVLGAGLRADDAPDEGRSRVAVEAGQREPPDSGRAGKRAGVHPGRDQQQQPLAGDDFGEELQAAQASRGPPSARPRRSPAPRRARVRASTASARAANSSGRDANRPGSSRSAVPKRRVQHLRPGPVRRHVSRRAAAPRDVEAGPANHAPPRPRQGWSSRSRPRRRSAPPAPDRHRRPQRARPVRSAPGRVRPATAPPPDHRLG